MATEAQKARARAVARIVITAVIIVAVAVVSFITLSPLLTNPPPRQPVLLDEMTTLTDTNYEQDYNLTLKEGEEIYIQVSGFGQPLDFRITGENRAQVLLEETDITFFNGPWTVPHDATYIFYVGAWAGTVKVRLTVSKLS